MPRAFWWTSTFAAQVQQLENMIVKLPTYQTALGWTNAQLADAILLCTKIIEAINLANQCRATMVGVTNWRDIVLYGDPKGSPAPKPPLFPVLGEDYTCGMVDQLFDLRDQIVANSGYTIAMGEDLEIVGAEQQPLVPSQTFPELKAVTANSNMVTITGSMQGLPVMQVEFCPKGQTYGTVAIVTNLPATFEIPMVDPEVPQLGTIRTIYLKNNAPFGNYSPNYDVTLA